MEAVIVNRRGKKMANLVWQKSVTIILFEITFCQTSLSFKQIFCKRPENIKWRSRQNTKVIALWHLSHTSVLLSSSSCCLLCKLTNTCLKQSARVKPWAVHNLNPNWHDSGRRRYSSHPLHTSSIFQLHLASFLFLFYRKLGKIM